MKTINPPQRSKINWTALSAQAVGVAAMLNIIPADMEETVTQTTLVVVPALIQVWRTWFTE